MPDETSAGSRLLLGLLTLTLAATSWWAGTPAQWPAFVAGAFTAGGLGFWLWHRGDLSLRTVLGLAILFRLFFFWLPPILSDDAYRYVWDGWLQAEGINPYRYRPDDPALAPFQEGPLFDALNSAGYYSVYPPFSQVVFLAGGLLIDAGWLPAYYLIKGLFLLLEVGALFVLARLVPARSLMLYAWHPLVLIEVAGQGHTEAAAVCLLVLTIWWARQGHAGWAGAALAGAGWVKLYPFVLVPFLWHRAWQAGRGRRVWWTTAGLVGAGTVLALPYAAAYVVPHVRTSLDLYVRFFEYNAGYYYGVKGLLQLVTGADWSKVLGPLLQYSFLFALPGLYIHAARRQWPLPRAFAVTLGAFFVLSTTVHPWYLLVMLPLAVLGRRPAWHWHALGLASIGTYLFYVGGPYWTWVILGWGAWTILAATRYRDALLQAVQRMRARRKAAHLLGMLPDPRRVREVLDLGAGEGYVGEQLQRRLGASVTLVDVLPMNRTALRWVRYDGRRLPFAAGAFDVTVLYFVLHHCADPRQVLREALRVTRGRVLIAESTYRYGWQEGLLLRLDRAANRLRSGGRMRAQEAYLHFRTPAGWRRLFAEEGADVVAEQHRGRWVHRQVFYAVIASQKNDETR